MKKLSLNKETLQILSDELQAQIAGGDKLSAYKTHCTTCSYYFTCVVKEEVKAE